MQIITVIKVIEISDRKWCVYVHTNQINGKRYVGITSQEPEKRWLNGCGYRQNLHFGKAIQKYGWHAFEHEIVYDNLSEAQAKELEVKLIHEWKTQDPKYGYNMTAGGEGVVGLKHSEESKNKMSKAKSGQNHPNHGKHLSEETKRKIGETHKGNKYCVGLVRSEETREKMSASKRKPVKMLDDNGVVQQVFGSAREAAAYLQINYKNISLCCLGHRQHAGGYMWQFA